MNALEIEERASQKSVGFLLSGDIVGLSTLFIMFWLELNLT